MTQALAGRKVLIVEDEVIVAMTLEEMLRRMGAEVVATAATLPAALKAVEEGGFDVAVLDVNMNGERSDPVAERLAEEHIPFVIATGYGSSVNARPGVPVVEKPYLAGDIADAVAQALS